MNYVKVIEYCSLDFRQTQIYENIYVDQETKFSFYQLENIF